MRTLRETGPEAIRSSPPGSRRSQRYQRNYRRYGTHELLIGLIPSASAVLDVGCASGYLGSALAKRGCRVWGVDVDVAALERLPSCYEDASLVDLDEFTVLPWPEQLFDVVLAADVLEHVRDPKRALRILTRYVAPGGRVIISLPNVAHASVRFPLLFGRFTYRDTGILDATHFHLYTFATARTLVESCGLRIDDTRGASDHFGAWLGGWSPVGRLGRGLLAYNIVVTARPSEGTSRESPA